MTPKTEPQSRQQPRATMHAVNHMPQPTHGLHLCNPLAMGAPPAHTPPWPGRRGADPPTCCMGQVRCRRGLRDYRRGKGRWIPGVDWAGTGRERGGMHAPPTFTTARTPAPAVHLRAVVEYLHTRLRGRLCDVRRTQLGWAVLWAGERRGWEEMVGGLVNIGYHCFSRY